MSIPQAEVQCYQLKGTLLPGNSVLAVTLYAQLHRPQGPVRILTLPQEVKKWRLTDTSLVCLSAADNLQNNNLEPVFNAAATSSNNIENDDDNASEVLSNTAAQITPVKSRIARLAQSPRLASVAAKPKSPRAQFTRHTSGSHITKSPQQSSNTPSIGISPQRSLSGDITSHTERGNVQKFSWHASNPCYDTVLADHLHMSPSAPIPFSHSCTGTIASSPRSTLSMLKDNKKEASNIVSRWLDASIVDEVDSVYVQFLKGEHENVEQFVLTLGDRLLSRAVVSSTTVYGLIVRLRFELYLAEEATPAFELGELARCESGTCVEIRITSADSTAREAWSVIDCSKNTWDSSSLKFDPEQGLLSGVLSEDPVSIRLLAANKLESEVGDGDEHLTADQRRDDAHIALPSSEISASPELCLLPSQESLGLPIQNHEEASSSVLAEIRDTVASSTSMSDARKCYEQADILLEDPCNPFSDTLQTSSIPASTTCGDNEELDKQVLALKISSDTEEADSDIGILQASYVNHTSAPSSSKSVPQDSPNKAVEDIGFDNDRMYLHTHDTQVASISHQGGHEFLRPSGTSSDDSVEIEASEEKFEITVPFRQPVKVLESVILSSEGYYYNSNPAQQEGPNLSPFWQGTSETPEVQYRDRELLNLDSHNSDLASENDSTSSIMIRPIDGSSNQRTVQEPLITPHDGGIARSVSSPISQSLHEAPTVIPDSRETFCTDASTYVADVIDAEPDLLSEGSDPASCISTGQTLRCPPYDLATDSSTNLSIEPSSATLQGLPQLALCGTNLSSSAKQTADTSCASSLHETLVHNTAAPVFNSLLKVDFTPRDGSTLRPSVVTCFFVFTFAQALLERRSDSFMDVDICGPDSTTIIMARVDDESVRWQTRIDQRLEDGQRLQSVRMPHNGFQVGQAFCLVINCTLDILAESSKINLPSVRISGAIPTTEEVQLARVRYPLYAQVVLDDLLQWTHISDHKDVFDRWKFCRTNQSSMPILPMQISIASLPILLDVPAIRDHEPPCITHVNITIHGIAEDSAASVMEGTLELYLSRGTLRNPATEPLLRTFLPDRYSVSSCQVNSSSAVCYRGLEHELVILDNRDSCSLTELKVALDFVLRPQEISTGLNTFDLPSFLDLPVHKYTVQLSPEAGQARSFSVWDCASADIIEHKTITTNRIRLSAIPKNVILSISYLSPDVPHGQMAPLEQNVHSRSNLKRLMRACFVLCTINFLYLIWQLRVLELDHEVLRNVVHNRMLQDHKHEALLEILQDSQQLITNHISKLKVESCPTIGPQIDPPLLESADELGNSLDSHDLGLAYWSIKNSERAIENAVDPINRHTQALGEIVSGLESARPRQREGFEIDPGEKVAFRRFLTNLFRFN